MADEPTRRMFKARARTEAEEAALAEAARDVEALKNDRQFASARPALVEEAASSLPGPVAASVSGDGAQGLRLESALPVSEERVAAPARAARKRPEVAESGNDRDMSARLEVRLSRRDRDRFLIAARLEGVSAQAALQGFVMDFIERRRKKGVSLD